MVVSSAFPRVARLGGACDGGLPGIAPQRLSGKMTNADTGVGMIRSTTPAASMPDGTGQQQPEPLR